MIQHLRDNYRVPRSGLEQEGEYPNEAAVLVPVTDHCEPEIVLTKRADHLTSHGGEVSFPGGKWEAGDPSLVFTALRESEEEIGLSPALVEVLNVGPPLYSLWGIKVTPYLGIVPHNVQLEANPAELHSLFRVPVRYFLEDRRSRTDVYFNNGREWWSPVYHYDGYKIWGLTARILVQFLNDAWNAGIERESAAPESRRKPRAISFD
ncbi:CoA pyrophosphatase [Gilvimarinus sp. F26214L]|uniref:CoA pyrophosphatase n=1 Tax=Gilvimarinus sp. DZF01 TaxID=3461371 RepID=UPI0040462613